MQMPVKCAYCGDLFDASLKHKQQPDRAKYCSEKCSKLIRKQRQGYVEFTADCANCGKPFSVNSRSLCINRKYCSRACRREFEKLYYHKANPNAGRLPTGTTGAIGELIVAADLLRQGFEVFRALSQSCSCDLAILYESKLIRVEVRTAIRLISGKLSFAFRPQDSPRHDLLALVVDNGQTVEYRPSLPELFPDMPEGASWPR